MVSNMQVTMPDLNTSSVPVKSQKGVSYKKAKSDYKKMEKQIANSGCASSEDALVQELEALGKLGNINMGKYCHSVGRGYSGKRYNREGNWILEKAGGINKILDQQYAKPKFPFDYKPLLKDDKKIYFEVKKINDTLSQYTDESKQTAYNALAAFDCDYSMLELLSDKEGEYYTISEEDVNFLKGVKDKATKEGNTFLISNLFPIAWDIKQFKDEKDREFIVDLYTKQEYFGACLMGDITNEIFEHFVYKVKDPLFLDGLRWLDECTNLKPTKIDDETKKNIEKAIDFIENSNFSNGWYDTGRKVAIDCLISAGACEQKLDFEKLDNIQKLTSSLGNNYVSSIRGWTAYGVARQLIDKHKLSFAFDKNNVDILCKIKETLESTRTNEDNERKHPLFFIHDNYEDDDKKETSEPLSNSQLELMKKNYLIACENNEANIIKDFMDEYFDGEKINVNAYRTIINLRQAGITYNSLLELTKSCINKDGSINASKLKAICDLKKAGALSRDIQEITDACEKDKDGNILESDLNICCSLSSANIAAVPLLQYIKKDNELLNIVKEFRGCEEFIIDSKTANGEIDENSLNLLKTILKNQKINTENELEYDDDFIAKVMRLSKDENGKVSEEASDICTSMIKNQERPEDILTALEICSDGEGHFDKNLTDLLWLLSEDETYFGLTEKLIKSCRNENGEIDNKKAEYMERLLKAGESPLNLVKINI